MLTLVILANLVALVYDVVLGIRVYEKYVVLPRLLQERHAYLTFEYGSAKSAERKRNKQVNDKLRRTTETLLFPVANGKSIKLVSARKVA